MAHQQIRLFLFLTHEIVPHVLVNVLGSYNSYPSSTLNETEVLPYVGGRYQMMPTSLPETRRVSALTTPRTRSIGTKAPRQSCSEYCTYLHT